MKPRSLSGSAKAVKGVADEGVVLRLRKHDQSGSDHDALLLSDDSDPDADLRPWKHVVCTGTRKITVDEGQTTIVELDHQLSHLDDGDVIAVRAGRARVLYQKRSNHVWLLTTERCDNYCLMCSQPPKRTDDSWLVDELQSAIALLPPELPSIGFTGGEPLLLGERFIDLLRDVKKLMPDTYVHVLSNGRAFADPILTRSWASLQHSRLSVGIPLYSAVPAIHDYVVQAKGAFDQTVLGIMRLKDAGQRVEIRIVLHRITVERLTSTCRWIARNMPFVDHVALMGLENTGFAIANTKELWVDPYDYRYELRDATQVLVQGGVKFSVFNLPLCLLLEETRMYAVKSISEWKNDFPEVCAGCGAKTDCAGFFSSGRPRISNAISPIKYSIRASSPL